ncbi:hypothetical protein [Escherichia coli]|uniref:hypothetical protein n=1 Tax=Escherichia coli TaxID=562 RepID=UPI002E184D8B|nr:hypothetical protein [Escherichia coli]
MSRKSIGISNERYLRIERAAVDITAKTGKVTKWSEIVNYLIDEYLNDAKQDMISKNEITQKNSNHKTIWRLLEEQKVPPVVQKCSIT